MVGPGEVDPELESETAEECAKYGKVTKCVIFEVGSYNGFVGIYLKICTYLKFELILNL